MYFYESSNKVFQFHDALDGAGRRLLSAFVFYLIKLDEFLLVFHLLWDQGGKEACYLLKPAKQTEKETN